MSTQIIERNGKPEYAVVPYAEYEALLDRLEDLEDIQAIDNFHRALERGEEELIPSEVVDAILAGENPVRIWRQYRDVTQSVLAEAAKVSTAYVSQVESSKRQPSAMVLRAMAAKLDVDMDQLMPREEDADGSR